MLHGKFRQFLVSGGHLTAYRIMNDWVRSQVLQPLTKLLIFGRALGRLTENMGWNSGFEQAVRESFFKHGEVLDHHGSTISLTDESQHLCMSGLAENHNLALTGIPLAPISFLDYLLQAQNHGTSAVDYSEPERTGLFISLGRFPMGPD